MKQITISRGKIALVDDENFEYLSQFKWYAHKGWRNTWYAVRSVYVREKQNTKLFYMHLEILNHPKEKIDHHDHDGLNNQKSNLRIATDSQNSANTTSRVNSSSIYVGVYFRGDKKKKWASCIRKNGRTKYIGSFDNEIDAAIAYNKTAIEFFGEFANLNKITA